MICEPKRVCRILLSFLLLTNAGSIYSEVASDPGIGDDGLDLSVELEQDSSMILAEALRRVVPHWA